jgi:hypothetical protein
LKELKLQLVKNNPDFLHHSHPPTDKTCMSVTDKVGWKKAHDKDSAPMNFESEDTENGGGKLNFPSDICLKNDNMCDDKVQLLG